MPYGIREWNSVSLSLCDKNKPDNHAMHDGYTLRRIFTNFIPRFHIGNLYLLQVVFTSCPSCFQSKHST